MSNAIEIEAKALVNKGDYQRLMNAFRGLPIITQTNYYVDDKEGSLRKEGISLRIREKNGDYEMTLKTPLAHGLLEKNCAWSKGTFIDFQEHHRFPDGDIKRFLTMLSFDINELDIKTSLTTKRLDVPYKGGKLSIDENHYSGVIDYEVELEYNNLKDAEDYLKELLESYNIPFVLNKKTKVSRAFEALNK